ncbi:MAG: tetratricopeptide repeat protein [Ferruginibacter sp.]
MNKMNQAKSFFLLLIAVAFGSAVFAQNIEDGKKFFFYERYTSAKKIFSQLVTANTNNVDAVYWLGQTEIAMDDSIDAKTLYQQTLMANSGSGLLLAGIGQLELMDGKTDDARQRFETAISLTKSKSIPVLNAIGFANIVTLYGDANYAIDKLKLATTLKGFKDPDVYINLGDAYRKLFDGGAALDAYQSALQLDNSSPIPSFKIGRLYESQGPSQEDVFIPRYNDAIAKDPTYGPVYYDLYNYFYKRDVNKSRDFLDKYIANSDPDPKDCYYQASILYASGLFQQSIAKSDECITADGNNPYPNLFGLKAYNYYKLGDSVNAKSFFDQYFAKQQPGKIGPGDYSTYASILLKFPGNDSVASTYIDKAIAGDSLEGDKIKDAKVLLDYYSKDGNANGLGDAYKKIIAFRKTPVNSDYQSGGFYYYKAGNYAAAAAIFDSATQRFPDNLYDYYMLGKSEWSVDSTMQLGLANAAFEKVIELGITDTVKNKDQLIGSYKYFVAYYINIKKDKETSLQYCDKILSLDPADAETLKNKDIISKMKIKPVAGK